MSDVVFQRIDKQCFIVHDEFVAESLPPCFVADVKKKQRNPAFHNKVFSFLRFCFDHWASDREFMNEAAQFDVFRNHLTVIAGYYDSCYTIDGSVRIEAKSLAYDKMDADEFKQVYTALINAAVRKIFNNCDYDIEQKLMSFF